MYLCITRTNPIGFRNYAKVRDSYTLIINVTGNKQRNITQTFQNHADLKTFNSTLNERLKPTTDHHTFVCKLES